MFKGKFKFIVLFVIVSLIILSSCRNNSMNEVNIDNGENINKNESGSIVRMGPKLNNLDDIEEEMIIDNSIGSFFSTYGSTPKTNGFLLKFSKFTGIVHYLSIDVVDDCDVTISINDSNFKDDFKAYVVLSNGELIDLPKDSGLGEANYSLIEGENIVALTGYKATGTFDIYIEPQDGVEVRTCD